jgi:ATP-dependent Lhr-like helicase
LEMMTSPPSNCEQPSNFELLDSRIQQWIWASGWTELRDAQERAIPLILEGSEDVIIAATTASGKTEAAFFPILTRLGAPAPQTPLAIYISPLKALINDQWRRLDELTDAMKIDVTPWHGDISQQRKERFLKQPRGCLLITPESLEALLCRRGHGLAGLFSSLAYVVVDELHAFIGTERGKQLQSLLHRIETALGRPVIRIGLSATLGDMSGAASFLRPDKSRGVCIVESKGDSHDLKVLIRGYLESTAGPTGASGDGIARSSIAADLFKVLRGTSNLVFPNARSEVEYYADSLRNSCEQMGLPNEFWPHHGNLSKDVREDAEAALKKTDRPATAICTSTLELGIDIGPVKSVVQIGPPPSVASLRQRLGRSGRRKGEPMILRGYCIEEESNDPGISELLRENLLTTVAMVRLLAEGWYEPIKANKLHASTLVQQILSTISQYGGVNASKLWNVLCAKGPFNAVSSPEFASLLRELSKREIIFQDATGLILLAPAGERITEHYSFYAAFASEEEYSIVNGNQTLGSMPISRPLSEESYLIFAGRRWQVISVSAEDKIVVVKPAAGGSVPKFNGAMRAETHDRVRDEIRSVLRSDFSIPFLDPQGQLLLKGARVSYKRMDLDREWILESGSDVQILPWCGDIIKDTLTLMLQAKGKRTGFDGGLSIPVRGESVASVREILREIADGPVPTPVQLAESIPNKANEKWDAMHPDELLCASFASARLDVCGAQNLLKRRLKSNQ